VEECRRRFAEVFAQEANEEKRDFARLCVKKIEVEPETGGILSLSTGDGTPLTAHWLACESQAFYHMRPLGGASGHRSSRALRMASRVVGRGTWTLDIGPGAVQDRVLADRIPWP